MCCIEKARWSTGQTQPVKFCCYHPCLKHASVVLQLFLEIANGGGRGPLNIIGCGWQHLCDLSCRTAIARQPWGCSDQSRVLTAASSHRCFYSRLNALLPDVCRAAVMDIIYKWPR